MNMKQLKKPFSLLLIIALLGLNDFVFASEPVNIIESLSSNAVNDLNNNILGVLSNDAINDLTDNNVNELTNETAAKSSDNLEAGLSNNSSSSQKTDSYDNITTDNTKTQSNNSVKDKTSINERLDEKSSEESEIELEKKSEDLALDNISDNKVVNQDSTKTASSDVINNVSDSLDIYELESSNSINSTSINSTSINSISANSISNNVVNVIVSTDMVTPIQLKEYVEDENLSVYLSSDLAYEPSIAGYLSNGNAIHFYLTNSKNGNLSSSSNEIYLEEQCYLAYLLLTDDELDKIDQDNFYREMLNNLTLVEAKSGRASLILPEDSEGNLFYFMIDGNFNRSPIAKINIFKTDSISSNEVVDLVVPSEFSLVMFDFGGNETEVYSEEIPVVNLNTEKVILNISKVVVTINHSEDTGEDIHEDISEDIDEDIDEDINENIGIEDLTEEAIDAEVGSEQDSNETINEEDVNVNLELKIKMGSRIESVKLSGGDNIINYNCQLLESDEHKNLNEILLDESVLNKISLSIEGSIGADSSIAWKDGDLKIKIYYQPISCQSSISDNDLDLNNNSELNESSISENSSTSDNEVK